MLLYVLILFIPQHPKNKRKNDNIRIVPEKYILTDSRGRSKNFKEDLFL